MNSVDEILDFAIDREQETSALHTGLSARATSPWLLARRLEQGPTNRHLGLWEAHPPRQPPPEDDDWPFSGQIPP